MARQQLRRYIWLIDTVRSAGARGITYEEVNDKWTRSSLNEDGDDFPWRTFQAHRQAILEEFDIEISCDRRDNTYRLTEEYNEYGSVKKTLIDALVLNNAIRETPDLNGSIVFNDNFQQQCMPEMIRAIKERQTIRFRYIRDNSITRRRQANSGIPEEEQLEDVEQDIVFQPYGLYNSTLWFTVGRVEADGEIHVYALHRLSGIESTDQTFIIPEDFNVKQYMTDFWVDEEYGDSRTVPDDAYTLEAFEAGKDLDLDL